MLASHKVRWRKSYWRDIKSAHLGKLVASIGQNSDGTWDVGIEHGLTEYLIVPFRRRVDAKRWAERRLMAMLIAGVE